MTTILPSVLRLFRTYIMYVHAHLPQNAPNRPTRGEHKCWLRPAFFSCCFPKPCEEEGIWRRE